MKGDIPYSKLIKLLLITTPLFGVLGTAPVLVRNKAEFASILTGFVIVASITFAFWAINILLLQLTVNFTFKGKLWLRYSLSIITCIILMFFLLPYIFPGNRLPMPEALLEKMTPRLLPSGRIIMPLIQTLSLNIIIIVLIELVFLKARKQKIEIENAQLHISNLEAKHSQLRQQLHPHFLFNSLSTLKALIKRNPEQADEYLVKLSELLRLSIYSNKQALVSLAGELEICVNYLNMQKVRFNEALDFNIDISPSMKVNGYVPVYSIQLLVENTIKHNMLTIQNPLLITITGNKEKKTVSVSNNVQSKLTIEDGNGVGLSNLSERYRLLGNHPIDINKENGKFTVTINVLGNENSNN